MTTIGLEIHIQLKTDTKLFCGCSSAWQGKEPNSNCCETCLGFPGSKPRINDKAIEYGVKIALALGCEIPAEMFFSRKNYFYPDMSKNFQITQYEIPIARNGAVEMDKKNIRIERINLEEDPARSVHTNDAYVLIDYNRSGVPLCEIVTAPDFTEPKDARLFLQKLASILEYLGVFDASMEAAIRIDANVSVNNKKEDRVEVKNISGFKDVQKALQYEIVRQKNAIARGARVGGETRGWDPIAKITRLQRTKETEEQYGYIFEPDLTRHTITEDKKIKIKKTLPEMATEKILRYEKQWHVPKELGESIVQDPLYAVFFEKTVKLVGPKEALLAAKWFAGEIKKTLNYNDVRMQDTKTTAEQITQLLEMIKANKIAERAAEFVLRDMITSGDSADIIIKRKEMGMITNDDSLTDAIDAVIKEHSKAITDYKSGKNESFDFLVGQIMKATKGRADPTKIREMLKKKI